MPEQSNIVSINSEKSGSPSQESVKDQKQAKAAAKGQNQPAPAPAPESESESVAKAKAKAEAEAKAKAEAEAKAEAKRQAEAEAQRQAEAEAQGRAKEAKRQVVNQRESVNRSPIQRRGNPPPQSRCSSENFYTGIKWSVSLFVGVTYGVITVEKMVKDAESTLDVDALCNGCYYSPH